MKRLLLAAAVLFATSAVPQTPPVYGCDSPESRQLDFWIGDWELSYTGADGKPVKSRNRITKTLDGCVILEEFTGSGGTKLDGRSFSTYDRNTRTWKQTWVDNTASYLEFTGGLRDGTMMFSRDAQQAGRKLKQRMVFKDVQADSLKWLWQKSDDGGEAWVTQWDIDYRRLK